MLTGSLIWWIAAGCVTRPERGSKRVFNFTSSCTFQSFFDVLHSTSGMEKYQEVVLFPTIQLWTYSSGVFQISKSNCVVVHCTSINSVLGQPTYHCLRKWYFCKYSPHFHIWTELAWNFLGVVLKSRSPIWECVCHLEQMLHLWKCANVHICTQTLNT